MKPSEERLVAYRRTIAIIVVVVFLVLAFLIIRPFLVAIFGAAVLAYLFYPLYQYITNHMPGFLPKNFPRETISAIIICLLIVLIVLIPMGSITGILTNELRNGYLFLEKVFTSPDFRLDLPPFIGERVGDIYQYRDQIAGFGVQIINVLQEVVKGIPNVFLNIIITIFSVYFFLKAGEKTFTFFREFFPLPAGRYKQILARLDDLSRGMILGQIVVGIIHGFLAWFAYAILGVPNPALWAFITALISILPVLGASLIWFPIAIYLMIVGYTTGAYWKGIVLVVYGLLVMTSIDNVLKPKIIGDRSRIHPLVILFGILGGIQLIGLPGIIIGPLVLGLFDVVVEIYRDVV